MTMIIIIAKICFGETPVLGQESESPHGNLLNTVLDGLWGDSQNCFINLLPNQTILEIS